ncbi:WRKY transcription factor 27 [Tripterygium wilfordii]|uniref:WRKY transcription factor 27 n=1 Tax=Tripterygium wilfordii TaxID=458696 RepID=A0A7J7CDZ9_TRIWF|nr:probable WRKY transcription factor 27 [Tripterygium wilfordii]KAF5732394.1 WRKY transcription factor 27 [Tripterygium wilfordii]
MTDWDLSAVVRSCNSSITTTQNALHQDPLAFLASLPYELENQVRYPFPNFVDTTTRNFDFDELQDLCMPFLMPKPRTSSIFNEIHHHQPPPRQPTNKQKPTNSAFVFGESSNSQQQRHPKKPEKSPEQARSQPSRPRKRKNQQKREVCRVTAENLSSDLWAWRKYGQKPIKGSPYPRNYYRCSSSKGCGARKQVERSNTDPNMFILTYTGDHTHPRPTHRNSLAGSTRNKVQKTGNKNDAAQASSAAAAPADRESEEVEEDEFEDFDDVLIPNLAINDDLFAELRGLSAAGAVDENFTPWSPGSSAATAGAGGG